MHDKPFFFKYINMKSKSPSVKTSKHLIVCNNCAYRNICGINHLNNVIPCQSFDFDQFIDYR